MITLYCCSVNSAQHFHLSHTCFLRAAFHSFPLTSSRRLGDRCTISFIDLLLVRSTKAQVSERTCVDLIAAYDESLNSQCSNRSALHRKTPIAFRNRSSTGGDRLTNCTIVDRSDCWCTAIDMGFQTKANKQEERTRPDDVYEPIQNKPGYLVIQSLQHSTNDDDWSGCNWSICCATPATQKNCASSRAYDNG